MSRPRTLPMGAALAIIFACLLVQATPSAAADDSSILQGLRTRVEAILRMFVAPHAAVSNRSKDPVAERKVNRDERQGNNDSEGAPPPSGYLMDMDPNGLVVPPPSGYLIDVDPNG